MRDSQFSRRPIGSGPFAFRDWKSDQYIVLDRFDGYWEGPPNYKRYNYRIIPDQKTQEMEFYAGTVDLYSVQPTRSRGWRRTSDTRVFQGSASGTRTSGTT